MRSTVHITGSQSFLAFVLLLLSTSALCQKIEVRRHSTLPAALTNNAVAAVKTAHGVELYSLLGLGPGKAWSDTLSAAYRFDPATSAWQRIADVPGEQGRLAATAVGLRGSVYVFGGYTVAEDHSEVSDPGVYRYDPGEARYSRLPDMPVPVDDSVSFAYRERYIYLVSGWHMSGNVNLVQLFDTVEQRWSQATPFPGLAVFGHAGGMVDGEFVVCDGVSIRAHREQAREFVAEPACFAGAIRPDDPERIDWTSMPHHPGPALYRMAAAGDASSRRIVFVGGSDNPYNYNGTGYDGRPSSPSDAVFAWDLDRRRWENLGTPDIATMDHRGLLEVGDEMLIVGGMRERQSVSDAVIALKLPSPSR